MRDVTNEIEALRLELGCRCGCGRNLTDSSFARKLFIAQGAYMKPFKISYGFRCGPENERMRGSEFSPALLGVHADIDYGLPTELYWIVNALIAAEFEHIRIYTLESAVQTGRRFAHVHIDGELPKRGRYLETRQYDSEPV